MSTPTTVEQAGELRSARIESLRAVAALAVFIGHTWGSAKNYDLGLMIDSVGGRILFGGGYGVYLFFALSGYLLFWPFVKHHFGDGSPIDLRRYALNRVLRIAPLYFVVMAAVLLVQEEPGTARQWLLFMSWSPNFATDTVHTVNGVVWSVVIELHFYLLLPLLALGLARLSGGSLRRAALILAALGVASLALRYFTFLSDPAGADQLLRYSLPSTFFYFVAGMLLAFARLAWERRPPRWLRGPLASADAWILASAAVWLWVFVQFAQSWSVSWAEATCALAAALLVGACVLPLREGRLIRLLELRVLAAIGVVSYSLYLWQIPILTWLDEQDFGLLSDAGFSRWLPVAGIVVLAWSFASYRLIEAPFLRLRRRWGSTLAAENVSDRPTPAPPASTGVPSP